MGAQQDSPLRQGGCPGGNRGERRLAPAGEGRSRSRLITDSVWIIKSLGCLDRRGAWTGLSRPRRRTRGTRHATRVQQRGLFPMQTDRHLQILKRIGPEILWPFAPLLTLSYESPCNQALAGTSSCRKQGKWTSYSTFGPLGEDDRPGFSPVPRPTWEHWWGK
jgi:hypothetical protein